MRFGAEWKACAKSNIHVQTEELMDRTYALVSESERELQCVSLTSQSYPPMISGAAQTAQQLAESMAYRGHQVLVIAVQHDIRFTLDAHENPYLNMLQ